MKFMNFRETIGASSISTWILAAFLSASLVMPLSCVKKEGTPEKAAGQAQGQAPVQRLTLEELFKGDPEGLVEFQRNEKLYNERKYDDVYKGFGEMVRTKPDAPWRPRAELYIGKARLARRHYDLALKAFGDIIANFPDSPESWEALNSMGVTQYQRGTRFQKNDPDQAKTYFRAAREELQKALAAIPGTETDLLADSRRMLAQCMLNLGDKAGAKTEFLKTAETYPKTEAAMNALYRLGGLYTEENQIEEAIGTYRKIVDNHAGSKRAKKSKQKIKELGLVGRKAAEFEVESWINSDGLKMEALRDKVVLFVFWATWCPHCRREMPNMVDLHEKYGDQGLVVVGATKTSKRQDADKVKLFVEDNGIPFPIAIDDGSKTSNAYVSTSIPGLAIVDKKGTVRWRAHPGFLGDDLIPSLLAEEG